MTRRHEDAIKRQAEAWRLHFVEDLPFSLVAERMGISRSSAAALVRKHKLANNITVSRNPYPNAIKRDRSNYAPRKIPIRVEFKFNYAVEAARIPDGISLLDLQDFQCCYIVRSQGRSHFYCGLAAHKRHGGYCHQHQEVMKS